MFKYILKRILLLIPIVLGVLLVILFIMELTPGDPATIMLGTQANPEAVQALNEELGYYDPFPVKFFNYVKNALRGDFGNSWQTGKPVFDAILRRFPVTLKLAFYSILLCAAIGIPLGVISAKKQYSVLDMACTSFAMVFTSMPRFWLGLLLVLLFSVRLGWLPPHGIGTWKHYVLPVVTLAAPTTARIMRLTRSTMLETIRQDFVRTAYAKGASERRITVIHELKNALLPVITYLGIEFGMCLGGAILIETVFSMQGISTMMIQAIRMKDTPQVTASIIFFAVLVCITNLLVDIMYAVIDPRIRAKYAQSK
jgi:peptide/nickel transport system permease protein